jgi:hypothetical protein
VPSHPLLKTAVQELNIDVPVLHVADQVEAPQHEDQGLVLFLYGGRAVFWSPNMGAEISSAEEDNAPTEKPVRDPEATDNGTSLPSRDLTRIPGVGSATAQALNDAGLFTFEDLKEASDEDLLAVDNVTTYTLTKIRDYLYVNNY